MPSGRYNKHDTARLRFIRDIALLNTRLGKLVPGRTRTCACCVSRRQAGGASKGG